MGSKYIGINRNSIDNNMIFIITIVSIVIVIVIVTHIVVYIVIYILICCVNLFIKVPNNPSKTLTERSTRKNVCLKVSKYSPF